MDTKPYHWNTTRIVGRILERLPDAVVLLRERPADGAATRPVLCYLKSPSSLGGVGESVYIHIQGGPEDPDRRLEDVDDAPVDIVEITNALGFSAGFKAEFAENEPELVGLYDELVRMFRADGARVVDDLGPFLPEMRDEEDLG